MVFDLYHIIYHTVYVYLDSDEDEMKKLSLFSMLFVGYDDA